MRVGVLFSGGQAPGGHNVLWGLLEALQKAHPKNSLVGFLRGATGLLENQKVEITSDLLQEYHNTGGFDLLRSGRSKIEKEEQFQAAIKTLNENSINALVVIGGDDSNTNAALMAEYFLKAKLPIQVIGVPKTIDGDLRGACLDISFGFDTACKVYKELIGNIARDALSAVKYYHFIKLMGRSASHIALECALATSPNLVLIGEEVALKKKSLQNITSEIADLITERAEKGKNYGVLLIPEGLIEFIPEMGRLIQELNNLLQIYPEAEMALVKLSEEAQKTYHFLPKIIQEQLLFDRDPHGNVQVSHIATESLLILKVKEELKKRIHYKGRFHPVNHFLGYEGRSAFPSNFDANYCFALGHSAALLLQGGYTGYMATVYDLVAPIEKWQAGGIPLASMIHLEERKGKMVPVIKKSLVDLQGEPFKQFAELREGWRVEDLYRYPGPIQFQGAHSLTDMRPLTLNLRREKSGSPSS